MSDWITSLAESFGALGVALLMFIENVFPPIPSELVMPLAGYTATQGDGAGWMRLLLMIVAGTVGALAGAILWYWIGRRIGIDGLKNFSKKHGRWLTLTPDEIDKADAWFDRQAGRDAKYDYHYSAAELDEWVKLIREIATATESTYVITNNHFGGQALANALEIRAALRGEPVAAPAELVHSFPRLAASARPEGQGQLFGAETTEQGGT